MVNTKKTVNLRKIHCVYEGWNTEVQDYNFFGKYWFPRAKALSSISISTTLHCVDQVRPCDLTLPLAPRQIIKYHSILLDIIKYYQIGATLWPTSPTCSSSPAPPQILSSIAGRSVILAAGVYLNIQYSTLYGIFVLSISYDPRMSMCHHVLRLRNTPL